VILQIYWFFEDSENELIPPDSDSGNTGDNDDETDDYIIVIPPDSSPLHHPLLLPFTANVGMNVVIESCGSNMSFIDLFCSPEFSQHLVD
jgi:hypothetical protein